MFQPILRLFRPIFAGNNTLEKYPNTKYKVQNPVLCFRVSDGCVISDMAAQNCNQNIPADSELRENNFEINFLENILRS